MEAPDCCFASFHLEFWVVWCAFEGQRSGYGMEGKRSSVKASKNREGDKEHDEITELHALRKKEVMADEEVRKMAAQC